MYKLKNSSQHFNSIQHIFWEKKKISDLHDFHLALTPASHPSEWFWSVLFYALLILLVEYV